MNIWSLVEETMSRPYVWGGVGGVDCCTAAGDIFNAIHGVDPMAPVRGRYRDLRSALRLVRSYGGPTAAAATLMQLAQLMPGCDEPGSIGFRPPGPQGHGGFLICAAPGVWVGKTVAGYATGYAPLQSWGV